MNNRHEFANWRRGLNGNCHQLMNRRHGLMNQRRDLAGTRRDIRVSSAQNFPSREPIPRPWAQMKHVF